VSADDAALAAESFCYLTTTGRVSGKPHTIEIWFVLEARTVYLLSGGGDRSDWVRNLRRTPEVSVRIRDQAMGGHARMVEDPTEDEHARDALVAKYQAGYDGSLAGWRRRSLPIAVDLDVPVDGA